MRGLPLKISIFFFTLTVALTARASWSSQAIDFANRNFSRFPGPAQLSSENRGYLATVWGGGMREVRYGEDLAQDRYDVKLPGYFSKSIEVYLRPHMTFDMRGEGRIRKAPLIVYIPGVFAEANDVMGQAMIHWFTEMGYHVLTLPNCWSRGFHRSRPLFQSEYPNTEADVVIELTKWAINKELGARYVEGVHLMGESLGALTAAVAYSKDDASTKLFNLGATLFWPPVNLSNAIHKLDDMIRGTEADYVNRCRSLVKKLKTKWRVMKGDFLKSPTASEVECSEALVAHHAFRKDLMKLAETVADVNKLPEPRSDLSFDQFIHQLAPRYRAALDPADVFGRLDYWLQHTSNGARAKVRIISSVDDFLNRESDWSSVTATGLQPNQVLLLPWGGHIGLTNHGEYRKFLKAAFARK